MKGRGEGTRVPWADGRTKMFSSFPSFERKGSGKDKSYRRRKAGMIV